jgi:Ca-activated chloride channel family protein
MFSFEYPYAFALLLLFFAGFKWFKMRSSILIFPNLPLLQQVKHKGGYARLISKYLAIFALVTALASPIIKDETIIQHGKGYELSLILDVSGSMHESNKIGIVKSIVQEFIEARKGDKLALSVFGDFAYVAVPLTFDKHSLLDLLGRLDAGVAGAHQTALYEALYLSSNIFKTSTSKNKIAILLTDGMDNAGTIPIDVAIHTAQKYHIKVYTIGVGGSSDYNPTVLQTIAKETGGIFFEANSKQRLEEIYHQIDSLEKSEITADKYIKKEYFFQYFLIGALVFMGLYMILSNKE